MIKLGEMIKKAREAQGLPRTKVAEFTGISPNSMVKYEKAGEKDGKNPSSSNLAKICMVLKIDPRKALDAINADNKYPDGNCRYRDRSFVKLFRSEKEWDGITKLADIRQRVEETAKIESHFFLLEKTLQANDDRLSRIEEAIIKNGPDQKDPSRSEKPKNNTEAVEAASTRPKKGRTDEAV